MKAFLIKTDDQTIEAVDFKGTLEHAYELLDCEIIETVHLDKGDGIYVDEEGLLRTASLAKGHFTLKGYPSMLIGRGLVTGHADGDWTDVQHTEEEINNLVLFL